MPASPLTGISSRHSGAGSSNAAVRAVLGAPPRDELERMVAAQMLACHAAALECYGQAATPGRHFTRQLEDLKLATKLARTFASLTLALAKHGGKSGHTVTVEHVHMRG